MWHIDSSIIQVLEKSEETFLLNGQGFITKQDTTTYILTTQKVLGRILTGSDRLESFTGVW